jgi:hypothetical protein
MAAGVHQRLADNPEHFDAHGAERSGGNALVEVQLDLAVHRHGTMHGDESLQELGERRLLLSPQPQVVDRPAQLLPRRA